MQLLKKKFNIKNECLVFNAKIGLSSQKDSIALWNALENDFVSIDFGDKNQLNKVHAIFDWFLDQGFKINANKYYSLSSLDLHSVLKNKKGNSFSLAILITSLAKLADVDLNILALPTDFYLSFSHQNKTYYFSLFSFRSLSLGNIVSLIKADLGFTANVKSFLKPPSLRDVFIHYVLEVKSSAFMNKEPEIAFKTIDFLIHFQGKTSSLIKERALVAHDLGCSNFAKKEIESIIENDPDNPLLDFLRYRLHEMRTQFNTYH